MAKLILTEQPELSELAGYVKLALESAGAASRYRRAAKHETESLTDCVQSAVSLSGTPEVMFQALSAIAWDYRDLPNDSLKRQNFRAVISRGAKVDKKTGVALFNWDGDNYVFSFRIQNGSVSGSFARRVPEIQITREKSASELQAERAAALSTALSDAAPGDVLAQFLEWLDSSTDEQLGRVSSRAASLRKERKAAQQQNAETA